MPVIDAMNQPLTLGQVIGMVLAESFPDDPMVAAFGLCGEFADICQTRAEELGLEVDFESVYMTLAESDCAFSPPPGVTLDQLHGWGVIKCLSHVWLVHQGRHYDAVTPEGVDNPFELRLFRQVCIEVMRQRQPEALEVLVADNPWWAESSHLTDEFLVWHSSQFAAFDQERQARTLRLG